MDVKSLRSAMLQSMTPVVLPETSTPVRYSFEQGIVDEETLPLDELKAAMSAVLDRDGGEALQYLGYRDRAAIMGENLYFSRYRELLYGETSLRGQLARWVGRRQAVDLDADSFLLTNGVSAIFPLLAAAFLDPGDGVLMEAMTLGQAERAFRMRGAVIEKVPIDDQGLIVSDLDARLAALNASGVRPKLLYTIPTFHLPTGAVMPQERRHELLALAKKWQLIVIEDSVYAEMRYEGAAVPSLLSLDDSGLVMQVTALPRSWHPASGSAGSAASPT